MDSSKGQKEARNLTPHQGGIHHCREAGPWRALS